LNLANGDTPLFNSKNHLEELRAMAKPPAKVQMTLEAICLLLGHKKLDWNGTKRVIMEQGFISNIVNFDSKKITSAVRNNLKKNYLSDPDLNYESVNRASKACGPLLKVCLTTRTQLILNSNLVIVDGCSS